MENESRRRGIERGDEARGCHGADDGRAHLRSEASTPRPVSSVPHGPGRGWSRARRPTPPYRDPRFRPASDAGSLSRFAGIAARPVQVRTGEPGHSPQSTPISLSPSQSWCPSFRTHPSGPANGETIHGSLLDALGIPADGNLARRQALGARALVRRVGARADVKTGLVVVTVRTFSADLSAAVAESSSGDGIQSGDAAQPGIGGTRVHRGSSRRCRRRTSRRGRSPAVVPAA